MSPILEATFCGWGYIPRSRCNFYIFSKPSSGQDSSPKLRGFISIWSVQSFSMKHHAVSWLARPRNNGPFSCYNLILGNIFKVPSLGRWTKKILYYSGHSRRRRLYFRPRATRALYVAWISKFLAMKKKKKFRSFIVFGLYFWPRAGWDMLV